VPTSKKGQERRAREGGEEGRKEWGGKGVICIIGFRGMDTTVCIIKQEAENFPTLRSLISVLDGIEEATNNVQLK